MAAPYFGYFTTLITCYFGMVPKPAPPKEWPSPTACQSLQETFSTSGLRQKTLIQLEIIMHHS